MATIKELREQAANVVTEARSMLDGISDKSTPEQRTEAEQSVDRALVEAGEIEGRIQRQTNLEAAERRANEAREADELNKRKAKRPSTTDSSDDNGESVTYRAAFAKLMCGISPVDMEPEDRNVLRTGSTQFEARAQTAGTTTAGGYTVPTELMAEIDKAMAVWGPMYDSDIARVIKTASGNPMKLPTVDDTASTAGSHTESAKLTDDGGKDIVIGQKSLDAYGYDSEFIRWSWELNADSIFSFEALLGELIGERLGRIANSQLTVGTGSSAPNGIVTASGLGKTTAGATAITADEVLEFVHSVDPAYRASPKSRFMFNDSTLLALRKLKDGQGNYLITEAPDGAGRLRIGAVSAPYSINQAMDSLAAAKKVMLYGDFSRYFVRKVGDPVIGVLRERFWPDMGIAGLIRFDGELANSAAIKHMKTA